MKSIVVKPSSSIKGDISLAGDKSIAHRSIILSAITPGKTRIKNFPLNQDCLSTINSFKKLGIKISRSAGNSFTVFGKGINGLKRPNGPIFVGDSGTTMRLLAGVLAGQDFSVTLKAGRSLAKRPMLRITAPLRMMGAKISARRLPCRQAGKAQGLGQEEYPPLTISGRGLRAISYKVPIASAQVKSAILLAGLYAKGRTRLQEKIKTRDHTERMLKIFKADIKVKKNTIVIKGGRELTSPGVIHIPGDISSASFFLVLALLIPGSRIRIKNICLNPSRTGIIRVLKRMGARIAITPSKDQKPSLVEPMGDLLVMASQLRGTRISRKEIPSLIDELPVLMLAACYAQGKSMFEGVQELRVKETDRIKSISLNLKKMGADIRVNKTGASENIVIKGKKVLAGAKVSSFRDHRTAMSMVVAGLSSKGRTRIDDISCIKKSFPDFLTLLKTLN